MTLDETDRKLLDESNIQTAIGVEPFGEIAAQVGLTSDEVVCRLKKLQEKGVIRRFGAKIKPRDIGLDANAMVAWKVPDYRVQEVGAFLSKLKEVTHCYERERVPGKWDYNLYAVLHSQKRASIEGSVKKLSETLQIKEYIILFSKTNLKKSNPSQRKLNGRKCSEEERTSN